MAYNYCCKLVFWMSDLPVQAKGCFMHGLLHFHFPYGLLHFLTELLTLTLPLTEVPICKLTSVPFRFQFRPLQLACTT